MSSRRTTRRPRRRGDFVLVFVLLVGLVGYWAWYTWFRPAQTVYTSSGGLELYLPPEQGQATKQRLLGLIRGARAQIEVAAFELDDLELGQALREAAARGVRVRMFNDDNYRRETRLSLSARSTSRARCETLVRLEVCYDSRDNALMHHKFVVVDGLGVWTGSANLTWNAFERNNENSLWIPSPELARLYRAEFDAIFGGQEQGLGRSERFQVGTTEGTVYFTPAGGREARGAILERIKRANREIWVAAFVLTDSRVIEALNQAHARGVRVRAVLDARNLESSNEEALIRAGIDARKDGNPYTMHDKVMAIDNEYVVTGSYNFSNSGFGRNNENLLILRDPALAERYTRNVEGMWRIGTRM
ncbi:MAG: phospholipase D-like domain-containing protein [Meiothermus sp.]|nr:phospholipase D-like domain-containing protein [Meiothermus sp.]